MSREEILIAIEGEIARLEQAAALLRESTSDRFTPIGTAQPAGRKRVLSPEARSRIAEAQTRRWARERAAKPSA